MKSYRMFLALIGLFPLSYIYAQPGDGVAEKDKYSNFGYVVVTQNGPEDGGDFGPNTPGTKTAGIQEAINYALTCQELHRGPESWARKHVYICKGWYGTQETIKIPWMGEQFILEARDSHISYQGTTGSAILIDSLMNCQIKLGYVVAGYLQEGAVVHCKPQHPFTHAPRGVMSNSLIEFGAIVGGGNVAPNQNRTTQCVGLLLDASSGPIICNDLMIQEINACDTSLYMRNPADGGGIINNRITLLFGNICNTTLQMGEPGTGTISENVLNLNCSGKVGVRIFGKNNIFTLNGLHTEPGTAIIFEPESRDNIIYSMNPAKGYTNNATVPTNRIITTSSIGFDIATPPFPDSGQTIVNRYPYTICIRVIDPGQVSGWKEMDPNGKSLTLKGPLTLGQSFILDPGDNLLFEYTKPAIWNWKALR